MEEKELSKGEFLDHFPCISREIDSNSTCTSSDGMAVYEHTNEDTGELWCDATCFVCSPRKTFSHAQLAVSSVASEIGISPDDIGNAPSGGMVGKSLNKKKEKPVITKEQIAEIKAKARPDDTMYRSIRKEINAYFGVLMEYTDNGYPLKQYYPQFEENKLVGFKIRKMPKDFSLPRIGRVGIRTQLSGAFRFGNAHKYCVIVGGELDQLAAYQMLKDSAKDKEYATIPVVSPTEGEGSLASQIKYNHKFFENKDVIVFCLDADKAGIEARDAAAKVLPAHKIRFMDMPRDCNDPCDVLLKKRNKEFVSNFYNATPLEASSIVASTQLDQVTEDELLMEKIPLPPFMHKMQKMMAGGIPLGYIVNLSAASGVGKTAIVNSILYYWIFYSPHKVGVVSLELSEGQYGLAMLSMHIGKKLQLFEDPQEAVAYINQPEILEKRKELWSNEVGEPRWYLIDERDGNIEVLQKQIQILVDVYDCKVIVLDPLQDALDGSSNEDQAMFMKWEKAMIKKGITFININHIRKAPTGQKAGSQGADVVEEDIQGSSSIYKSGGANISFSRDKYNEDEFVKNTVTARASKIRWTGYTGNCGEYYYDNETATLHDKEAYLLRDGGQQTSNGSF